MPASDRAVPYACLDEHTHTPCHTHTFTASSAEHTSRSQSCSHEGQMPTCMISSAFLSEHTPYCIRHDPWRLQSYMQTSLMTTCSTVSSVEEIAWLVGRLYWLQPPPKKHIMLSVILALLVSYSVMPGLEM